MKLSRYNNNAQLNKVVKLNNQKSVFFVLTFADFDGLFSIEIVVFY